MDWWMGLLRFAVGFGSGWLLGWLVIRGVKWCWGLRRPKPSGAGERSPIEDQVSHKAMMRASGQKAWTEEWIASLSRDEREEIDALLEEKVRETGIFVPYDFEDRLRMEHRKSEVQARIEHLAAGRPELIERPKDVVESCGNKAERLAYEHLVF
jgi:hypothetical protein